MFTENRIALFALIALGAWIFVALPLIYLPSGTLVSSLQNWQTSIAAGVALVAASIAFHNTTRSLSHAERLEARRRSRKHAAVRAMLPLALADIARYARETVSSLEELIEKCDGETLPRGMANDGAIRDLPTQSFETLSEFIEYSEPADSELLEVILACIQIHDSRVSSLVASNSEYSNGTVMRTQLENLIVDAAIIYAGASSFFNYARRYSENAPQKLSWGQVESALIGLDVWSSESYPRVSDALERRRKDSSNPLEGKRFRLSPRAAREEIPF